MPARAFSMVRSAVSADAHSRPAPPAIFEDLVFLCESKGFSTGMDIEKLLNVRGILRSEMPGETLYGGLARAGLPSRPSAVAA
jgi:hypothetical protein